MIDAHTRTHTKEGTKNMKIKLPEKKGMVCPTCGKKFKYPHVENGWWVAPCGHKLQQVKK